MIVMKFGGTSVQDADALRRLSSIVARRLAEHPVVVVSALAGVTNTLVGLVAPAARSEVGALERAVAALVERHAEVAAALGLPGDAVQEIRGEAARLVAELSDRTGVKLSPAETDRLTGVGELWSSWLTVAALGRAGIASAWVDARDVMATDDRFGRAVPKQERIRELAQVRLGPLLDDGRVPVTQGFIGSSSDGRPTTLGRGGSDFTASLLGAAMDAERVEIWTDVDGVMTADPRIVPDARTLRVATYDEVAELATFGARVLHPATQTPLAERGIPLVVLNARDPDLPGTTITSGRELERPGDSPVRSIAWKRGVIVINVRAPRMFGMWGFLRQLFEVFERHEVSVDVLASSEVSVSVTIDDEERLPRVLEDLSGLGTVHVDEGRAIVSVIGIGLRTTRGVAARVFRTVEPANVEMISQGSSEINITFVVREEDAPDVVRRLHREFIGAG
jgi:aspartate kinase